MQALIGALALLSLQTAPGGWVWTLYEDGGAVTLANEVPDTPQLRATLECQPGSGVVKVSAYGVGPGAEFATLTSGSASATGEVQPSRGPAPRIAVMTQASHPVFAAFSASGALSVRSGDRTAALAVPGGDLPKLARFAELCGR